MTIYTKLFTPSWNVNIMTFSSCKCSWKIGKGNFFLV